MKIWILRPVKTLRREESPWEPWFDKAFGFIVCDKTEEAARKQAHAEGGDENYFNEDQPWLDSRYTSCVELAASDKPYLIMKDFAAA